MLLFPSLNKYKARTCTCPAGASAPGSPCAGPAMPAVVPGLKAVPCRAAGAAGLGWQEEAATGLMAKGTDGGDPRWGISGRVACGKKVASQKFLFGKCCSVFPRHVAGKVKLKITHAI